ncbi:MAG TPA: zinc ribbon domain-containing protein [Thermoanaerobacterium sp.]|nr:zinc ribbon domain-containing protein [Thermoanaerobacterium sp.]
MDDIPGLVYCPKCNEEIPNRLKFCTNCGTPIKKIKKDELFLKCPKCHVRLPSHLKFCTKCGERLERVMSPKMGKCPICNTTIKPGMRFCTECGTPLKKARIGNADISRELRRIRKEEEIRNKEKEHRLGIESKILQTGDMIFRSIDKTIKETMEDIGTSKKTDHLVCDTCGSYYPITRENQIKRKCECGGRLTFKGNEGR